MRILHAMLAPGRGGIEFAFVRWTQALTALGHEMHGVVSKGAQIAPHLPAAMSQTQLRHAFDRDPLAIFRLHGLLAEVNPDIIITHGNRAGRLLAAANHRAVPHLAVLHRPRFKGLERFDAIACVSRDLMQQAQQHGVKAPLHHVPNFLMPGTPVEPPRALLASPPIVGMLGRLVPEKGADLFIDALGKVKSPFRAIIGGEGPERPALEALLAKSGLSERVTIPGWVQDTATFYRDIDLLCVPSRSESFGLIVPEAWAAGVPVISTRTSGPSEIITHGQDGLLCDISAHGIADAIEAMLSNPERAVAIAKRAQETLKDYTMDAALPRIDEVLRRTSSLKKSAASAAAD